MLLKRELLLKLVRENELNSCSIVGKPTKEVVDAFFKSTKTTELFKKYNISNPLGPFQSTPIGVYFPTTLDMQRTYTDICMITISRDELNEYNINKITDNLMDDIYEFYQTGITPHHFNMMIANESFDFRTMMLMIAEGTTEVSKRIGKSSQTVSDMIAGRTKCSIDTLAALMEYYPLLPWENYIRGFLN